MEFTLDDPERLYRAVVERDRSFDGRFFFGVRSTGVFCRPGCPARRPRRENCLWFRRAEDARAAGLRPCLRCRPLEPLGAPSALVSRLLALVEAHPGERLDGARLGALGIDPRAARRQFRAHTGQTFAAYQRSRRLALALRELETSGDRGRAMDAAGYAAPSGFAAALDAHLASAPRRAPPVRRQRRALPPAQLRHIETPLGTMVAVASAEALCLLEFADRRGLPGQMARLERHVELVPDEDAPNGAGRLLAQLETELATYFRGELVAFAIPLALLGTAFERAVWTQLLAVPYGTTVSYGELSLRAGRPGAARATGRANGANALAIVVPCHRVVGASGALVGYAGHLWRKRRLLELEREASPRAP